MPVLLQKEKDRKIEKTLYDVSFKKRSLFVPVFDLQLRKKLE